MSKQQIASDRRSLRSLDWLNLFLADVRDGVGPYLGIYLLATHNWNPASIGVVMSVSGMAGVIAQTPSGLLVDATRHKRLLVVIGAFLIALSCLTIVFSPRFQTVVAGQVLIGIAAALFPPTIAAITLGMVGYRNLNRRVGRNEAFNHTGNVVAAALAGLLGHFLGREWIFYLVAAMALGSAVSVLSIQEHDIDHDLARGAVGVKPDEPVPEPHTSGFLTLLQDRNLLIFSVSVILFHFANAAMLPLVGQYLAVGKATGASLYMSACIIVAQLVMIPVSHLCGRLANALGHKAIFLIAFLVLPIRGVLYTLSNNPYFLVSVQILDGIGAGIFGVLSVLVVAELTKGTGRFNFVQGAIATAVGIGASLSNLMTGFIVQKTSYNIGFLSLAGIAVIALLVYALAMPETSKSTRENPILN